MNTRVPTKVQPRIPTGRPSGRTTAATPAQRQAPDFSSKLLAVRLRAAGLTRQQLQGEVLRRGVNTHVSRLFAGGQPSLKLAWAIADALGCRIEDLLEAA